MAGYFEPVGGPEGGAAVALDEVEISILRSLTVQLLELIGPGEEPSDDEDPLAALFADGPSEPPTDPALARLFPDAYGEPGRHPEDEERTHSAEFRRYTENDLRTRKREDGLSVIRALDALDPDAGAGGAVLKLTVAESQRWLGALNDLRLTIGSRLDVSDEDTERQVFALPDDDPDKPLYMAYLWLGGLQESLVQTLLP